VSWWLTSGTVDTKTHRDVDTLVIETELLRLKIPTAICGALAPTCCHNLSAWLARAATRLRSIRVKCRASTHHTFSAARR